MILRHNALCCAATWCNALRRAVTCCTVYMGTPMYRMGTLRYYVINTLKGFMLFTVIVLVRRAHVRAHTRMQMHARAHASRSGRGGA